MFLELFYARIHDALGGVRKDTIVDVVVNTLRVEGGQGALEHTQFQ